MKTIFISILLIGNLLATPSETPPVKTTEVKSVQKCIKSCKLRSMQHNYKSRKFLRKCKRECQRR